MTMDAARFRAHGQPTMQRKTFSTIYFFEFTTPYHQTTASSSAEVLKGPVKNQHKIIH